MGHFRSNFTGPRALAGFLLLASLQSCVEEADPKMASCTSSEEAARHYFGLIEGDDAPGAKFQYEEYAEGLSGYEVIGRDGMPLASMVIQDSDCSLRFFSNMAVN